MDSPARALVRALIYGAWTATLLPAQCVAVALRLPLARRLPVPYHRGCCRILGIRVESRGTVSQAKPTLFVANHCSYFDIAVLGSLIKGSFVAKKEVARWPLFGLLAKLQRSVFVDRRGLRAADHRDTIGERLSTGDNIILFPEGTSCDGNRILPFKSALFAAAKSAPGGQDIMVQPVSIAYTRLDDAPLRRALRPYYAWYGEMAMLPHLWKAMNLGKVTVEVDFHPSVRLEDFQSRKALAEHCHHVIAVGVEAAVWGRNSAIPRNNFLSGLKVRDEGARTC